MFEYAWKDYQLNPNKKESRILTLVKNFTNANRIVRSI